MKKMIIKRVKEIKDATIGVFSINEAVSKDRRILIHSGNYGKDTSGCIIIGSDLGENGIFNSIKKFKEFLEVVKFDDFIVEIDNAGAI